MSLKTAHLEAPYPDVTFCDNIPSEWIESLFRLKNTTNPIHRKVVPSMYQAILKETICASIRIDGQIIATGLGILDRDYIGIYAIHVKEEYRKHGYARQICTGLLKEGMKKVRRMLTFRSLKEMILPGHFINHSDFTSFIPTGSACSRMKMGISHLKNKKAHCKAIFYLLYSGFLYIRFSGNRLICN